MNIQDIFYHGIRSQIRRIVGEMTDLEIARGLTAFEDGASTWSDCFFARALPELELDAGRSEAKLMKHFGLRTAVPIRIVYCTFDGLGVSMTRDQLRDFIHEIRMGTDGASVVESLRSLDFSGVEDREVSTCR